MSIPRSETEQLRVCLDEFEWRPFVSVRVWAQYRDGRWLPTRKGVTVRVRELGQTIGALSRTATRTGQGRKPSPRSTGQGRPVEGRLQLPGLDAPVDATPAEDMPF